MKKTELRERFDGRGFAVNAYARAKKVSVCSLSAVLAGRVDGKREGDAREIIKYLAEDGVWVDEFPWEQREQKVS